MNLLEQVRELRVARGVGNLYIGPERQPKRVPQLLVAPDARLPWEALDALSRVDGEPWAPRWLQYHGDDPGLWRWLAERERPLDKVQWHPKAASEAHATDARVEELEVHHHGAALDLRVPTRARALRLVSPKEGLVARRDDRGAGLGLILSRLGEADGVPWFQGLCELVKLTLTREAGVTDLLDLARWAPLEALQISGPCAHLEALARLPELRRLTLYGVFELDGFPAPEALPALEQLLIEDTRSSQVKPLKKAWKARGVLTVRRARSDAWMAEHVESPFAHWELSKKAKKAATAAFYAAREGLQAAPEGSEGLVLEIVASFIAHFNALDAESPGLETMHREDIAGALETLLQEPHAKPYFDAAWDLFEGTRTF